MQSLDKTSQEKSDEKDRYSEGDSSKRGESPSKVKDPMDGRSTRSSYIKSAATAYKKKSENDTDAVGRGFGR